MATRAALKKSVYFSAKLLPAPTTWVLAASRTQAQIFSWGSRLKLPRLLEEFSFPEGRLKTGQLISDRPGQSYYSGSSERHPLSIEEDAHDRKADLFAKKLTDVLENGCANGRFDRLVLVAEPFFMGKLRRALSPQIRKKITASVLKELPEVSEKKLLKYLGNLKI